MSPVVIILVAMVALLGSIAYLLNEIRKHVDILRRIAWKQMFGERPHE